MNIVDHFFSEKTNLSPINKAKIVLIPKSDTPVSVTDYRPISVINLVPKLISKILANRLRPHMPDLISEHQTAFIHDRYIAENFLATREALHHVSLSKRPAILLKLDFRKAFDTLDWGFLMNVMTARGFPAKFTRWIFHLLSTSSSSLLINGQSSPYFRHKRGLRQGDPLSPYLFILAADVLQEMSNSIPSSPSLNLTAKLSKPLLMFQYADDTIVLLSARGSIIRALMLVLHSFSSVSGLQVNFSKSAFVPLSISDDLVCKIQTLLGCNRQNLPLTYLGMPLTLKAPTRIDFLPLMQKMERRLEGWRARFISKAGRLHLVKSMLSAIPTYYMSCFRFPKWLVERLDSIRRNFLWSGHQSRSRVHLLNWQRVCLPVKCGGLGVPNLLLQNLSLLMRWWWRLFVPDNRQWRTYATAIYALTTSPLLLAKKGSFFWNSIRSLRPLFHSCSQFQCISGSDINFLFDGCDGLPLIYDLSGPIAHKSISLCQASASASTQDGMIYTLLPAPLTRRHHSILQKLRSFAPAPGRDKLLWTISPSSSFTVKPLYRILSHGGKILSPIASLWKLKVTPSMRLFFFLMMHNKILTQDNLQRRSIPHSQGCAMCPIAIQETVMHLFFRCTFARQVWTLLSAQVGYQIIQLQDSPMQTFLSSIPSYAHCRRRWGAIFVTTAWLLWKERNNRTFRNMRVSAPIMTARIMHEADLCLKHC